jgi:branched-subunit amino acid transport protein AzlD
MWLVFLFFILFLFGIIFLKIKIIIFKVYIDKKTIDYKILIKIYLWRVIPFLILNLNKNSVSFFGIKIRNNQIINNKIIKKLKKKIFSQKLNIKDQIRILKKANLKIEESNFILKIGAPDILFTNILVVLISSVIPIALKYKNEDIQKIRYKILPEFNKLKIDFSGKITICLDSVVLKNKKGLYLF